MFNCKLNVIWGYIRLQALGRWVVGILWWSSSRRRRPTTPWLTPSTTPVVCPGRTSCTCGGTQWRGTFLGQVPCSDWPPWAYGCGALTRSGACGHLSHLLEFLSWVPVCITKGNLRSAGCRDRSLLLRNKVCLWGFVTGHKVVPLLF